MTNDWFTICECTECDCGNYVQVFDEDDPEYDPTDGNVCENCIFGEHTN